MIIWLTGVDSSRVARALVSALSESVATYLLDAGEVESWQPTIQGSGLIITQETRLAMLGARARAMAATKVVVVAEVAGSITSREEQKRLCWEAEPEVRFIEVWVQSKLQPAWYHPPDAADVEVNPEQDSIESCVERILAELGRDQL